MAKQHTQAEADIIFNRANVALARSQRLIESWLPTKASETTTETDAQDDHDLKNEPETLGVGARINDDLDFGLKQRRANASSAVLLEQLIGKKAARGHLSSKSRPNVSAKRQEEPVEADSDKEEGRAASIRSKRPKRKRDDASRAEALEDEQAGDSEGDRRAQPSGKARGGSYIDQVLTAKASKARPGRS